MNPISPTESAEQRFQQLLEEFFISKYDEKSLPSHGIYHHRRVWGYAKEILNGRIYNDRTELAENLIIASYLHDIGMSVEKGPLHGRHSMNLCTEFLTLNKLDPEDYIYVLEAILFHDRKDYLENEKSGDLLKILSLADDMDAFGFTGIYRYAEIYITRGIKPGRIGYSIKENALIRFNNFEKAFRSDQLFLQKQKERYILLDDFFSEYNKRVTLYNFGESEIHGYCGIIELITNSFKEKTELLNSLYHYADDKVINWFFKGLMKDML